MSKRRASSDGLAAVLGAAMLFAAAMAVGSAAPLPAARMDEIAGSLETGDLAQANVDLQAGQADMALALLTSLPQSAGGQALDHNLVCRVRFELGQFDAAATECEQAARLEPQNSDYHLWLGRALGEKADRASFLTAFSLAKRTRAEFEEAVRLDPRNESALSDLGDFYRQAPGVVGGGVDKAQGIVDQLDKVDAARAHQLRGRIAEQQKDYAGAEREYKLAIQADAHPALDWTTLAGFYGRRQRFDEMDSAVHSVAGAAAHDRHAAVALYDGAGVLTEFSRDPAFAATLLEDYLANPAKTEEGPAFVAHVRLARLKAKLGDPTGAERERTAALDLAREYRPAQDFKPRSAAQGEASPEQQASNRRQPRP